jgi:putative endonuclease
MSNWYVYIILTQKNRLYTGVSTDPERRFIEHLCDPKKGAKFFRSDTPIRIVYLENCENYSAALKREYSIKQYSTIKKWDLIE